MFKNFFTITLSKNCIFILIGTLLYINEYPLHTHLHMDDWNKFHVSIISLTFLSRKVKVAQSCLTLCNPMDYTVNGILQARILEWVAFPFSSGSSQPRDWTQVSHIAGRFFTSWATGKPKNTGVGRLFLLQCTLQPRNLNGVSCVAVDSLPTELWQKPCTYIMTAKIKMLKEPRIFICIINFHICSNKLKCTTWQGLIFIWVIDV